MSLLNRIIDSKIASIEATRNAKNNNLMRLSKVKYIICTNNNSLLGIASFYINNKL